MPLLHALKQGALDLGGCPVNFIGKHEVMEYGAALEFELPCFRAVNLTASDVGRQQVRGKLDSVEITVQVVGKGFDGGGFGQTRCAFDQQVAVGKQRDQQTIHQFFLSDYPFG